MNFLKTLLLFSLTIIGCNQEKQKLNVLFIIADDLTATAVSSYENKACQTPNIDKLSSNPGANYLKTMVITQLVLVKSFIWGYL
jgi:hypothetical protein